MTDREKLIELITDIENQITLAYPYTTDEYRIGVVADHLITNGVTFTSNNGYMFTASKEALDKLPKADAKRIAEAKENISKYEKR